MPQGDGDKLNRIEELKGKLFTKSYQTKIEHRDSFSHLKRLDVPDAWEPSEPKIDLEERFFMKTSIFKNFFIFSIIFFALTLGYATYVFFAGGNTVSNNNIDISIIGNTFVSGGEELPLIVGVTNRNNSPLQLVDLVMEYPKNRGTDLPNQMDRLRVSLGTIPAGAVRNENLKVILFGEQGSVRSIKITLEYRVEDSNAIFIKEKTYEVTITSTPLNISVDAPATISPNQNITLNIKSTLNATKSASRVLLKLDYPVGFQFVSSMPVPTLGNNIWALGDLAPGAERNVSITGKMIDVFDGEEKTFHIKSGSQSLSDKSAIDVLFNSLSQTILIKKAFIEAKLFINGAYQRQYASDSQTSIRGEIRYINNLETKVNDLVIAAKISGNAVDKKKIRADRGFYDSAKDLITWDKNSESNFKEINPGEGGSVGFTISPVSLFSDNGEILYNPLINIEVGISGKQMEAGYAVEDLRNVESSVIRIISDVGLAAKALYYSGPFVNRGLIPPKVGKETTYTITWTLSNTANNISNGIVRSSIPSWIRFMNVVSPSEEELIYNSSTREIVWNAGRIPKGTSITQKSREVSFQVGFTPSLSQVGTTPAIINEAVLTGHDDFANVDIRVNKASLRTRLDSDAQFPALGGTVVE